MVLGLDLGVLFEGILQVVAWTLGQFGNNKLKSVLDGKLLSCNFAFRNRHLH